MGRGQNETVLTDDHPASRAAAPFRTQGNRGFHHLGREGTQGLVELLQLGEPGDRGSGVRLIVVPVGLGKGEAESGEGDREGAGEEWNAHTVGG